MASRTLHCRGGSITGLPYKKFVPLLKIVFHVVRDRLPGSYTPVAENSGARQCSRAVACLTELAVLPTVMAKLDDARAATTAKTTSGHEPKKQGVFVEAHQRWSTGRFAGSGVFLELDQRRSS